MSDVTDDGDPGAGPSDELLDLSLLEQGPAPVPATPPPSAATTPATAGGEALAGERLTTTQQSLLDQLGTTARPTFDPGLGPELRQELENSLVDAAEAYDAWWTAANPPRDDEAQRFDPLFVSKHKISQVHGCETRYLADEEADFVWTVATARGIVSHKAIELSIAWRGQPTPLDLVHGAIDRLESDPYARVAEFLQTLDEATRADLMAQANDRVAAFFDGFPPLRRQWRPVTEARVRADLADDRIVLSGKVDLSLGYARGNEAGRVLLDMKTGAPAPTHVDDLRFYALLETLKSGTPPRMLVNYYLDGGQARTEAVTEDLLWSTAQRTVDAVGKIVELRTGHRAPSIRVGPPCRWCVVRDSCGPGQAYLEELAAT